MYISFNHKFVGFWQNFWKQKVFVNEMICFQQSQAILLQQLQKFIY